MLGERRNQNRHAPDHARAGEALMRDLNTLARVLNRIDDPSARKAVIMSKRGRNQLTDFETRRLIQMCEVAEA